VLNIGDTVERYKVEGVLGHGGVATVYKVRHTELGTLHALKMLQVGNTATRDRLLKEGRTQAALMHTNVVRVTDILRVGDNPGLVMEYVDGPSLQQHLEKNPPELDRGLRLFRGIVRGVAAAHYQGIIHRDLKPANVLLAVTHEGIVPKVADFGLLKSFAAPKNDGSPRTGTGMSMGTPQYMAPEQVRDASRVDQRADLFSLGVILYELVCGETPFKGSTMLDVMNNITMGRFTAPERLVPGLPPPVRQAVVTLLSPEPEDRYDSCDDLLQAMFAERTPAAGLAGAEITADPTLPPDQWSEPTQSAIPTPGWGHVGWELGAGALFFTAVVMMLGLMINR